MDLSTLQGIVELMEKYDLSHVKLDDEGGKVEIDRSVPGAGKVEGAPVATTAVYSYAPWPAAPAGPAVATAPVAPAGAAPAPASAPAPAAPATPAPAARPVDDGAHEVSAPMVGVFYAAPAPGADPFVTVGAKVKKGDTLCIVEAMKCMNEIAAECDGTVVDICVSDGELVEYGRCLMKIMP